MRPVISPIMLYDGFCLYWRADSKVAEGEPKVWSTIRLSAYVPRSEWFAQATSIFVRIITFLALAGVWAQAGTGDGRAYLVSYMAIAQALGFLLQPTTAMGDDLANGTVATRMLWPISLVKYYVSQWLGHVIVPSLISGCLILMAWHIAWSGSVQMGRIPVFLVSLLLGVIIGIEFDFIFSMLIVRVENETWFANAIRWSLVAIFNGSVIPFVILPESWQGVLRWQPFASMANIPIDLLVSSGFSLSSLAIQLIWVVVFTLVCVPLYRATWKRITVLGG